MKFSLKKSFILLLVLTFTCKNPLRAMQKQKAAAGTNATEVAAVTRDPELKTFDLKRELGYSSLTKRLGEEQGLKKYLEYLQILARALYLQEQKSTSILDCCQESERGALCKKQFQALLPPLTQTRSLGSGKRLFILPPLETTKATIASLQYHDLLINPALLLQLSGPLSQNHSNLTVSCKRRITSSWQHFTSKLQPRRNLSSAKSNRSKTRFCCRPYKKI
jgi:hypothetical protein